MSANVPATGIGPVPESAPQASWAAWLTMIARGLNQLLKRINVGVFPSGYLAPTGNNPTTIGILDAEGTATSPTLREFQIVAGITSSQPLGTNAGTNNDKVAIYAAAVANHSSGATDADTWGGNFVEIMNTGYTGIGQVLELDINNNTGSDRLTPTTNPNSLAGVTPAISYGMEVTGAGTNRNTVAYAINGAKWQYGYMALSDISQAAFYENVNSTLGLDLEGTHTAALGIGLAGNAPQASAVDIRQGANNRLLVRAHQNLASGSAITSGNDAGNAFAPLEIQGSTVLLSPSGTLGINLGGNAPLSATVDLRQGTDKRLLLRGPQNLASGMALSMNNDLGSTFVPLEIQASILLHSAGPVGFEIVSAPASPPTGQFYLFCDSADGKLKAKGPSGTVTILAIP